MIAFELFLGFGRVGLFGFGGGPAMIPLLQEECVDRAAWVTSEEFVDLLGVGMALPGPLAVKLAWLVGFKMDGITGGLAALVGVTAPAVLLVALFGLLYLQHRDLPAVVGALEAVRPVVVGLLAWTVITLLPTGVVGVGTGLVVLATVGALAMGLHPAVVVALALGGGAAFLRP